MNNIKYLIGIILVFIFGVGAFYFSEMENIENIDKENREENVLENKNSKRNLESDEYFVYETEAESAEECSSFEEYDEEAGLCYFECSSETECKEIEDEIENELSSWAEDYENDREPFQENENQGNENVLVSYKVSRGENISFVKGKDSEEYKNIWNEIKELSPNNISDNFIETFEIYSSPNDDTLAFVDDEDTNGKWRIGINLPQHKQSTIREQKATLIHELMHIISLNTTQLSLKDVCTNLKLEEGCANTNSYINGFNNLYWKNLKTNNYDPAKHVTEYASTDVVEDLAESFTFFILEKDKEKLGNLIKDQKIKYFYNFPELVSLRSEMRGLLGQNIVRAKKALKK